MTTTTVLYLLTELVQQQSHPRTPEGVAHFMTSGYGGDRPGWDDVVTAGFLACEEEGLIESVKTDSRWSRDEIAYRVTDTGRRFLAIDTRALLEPLGEARTSTLPTTGDRALWLWLIRHGGTLGFMESRPDVDNGNMLHLRACGLDWDRTEPVRDDVWTTVDGTFADPETHHGVSGAAVCRCGLVGGSEDVSYRDRHTVRPEGGGPLQVHAEVTGLVDLLRGML